MGLTGSTLVFYKAIDEWLNPDQLTTAGAGPYRPLSEVVAAARAESPPDGWLDQIRVPSHAHGTFQAWYKRPPDDAPGEFRWLQVTIDPYTARVLSRREWGGYLMSFIYELHESLLLQSVGEAVVGCIALLLLISVGTGIYLLAPHPRTLRHVLAFNARGSLLRRHYAWHRFIGFVSALVLFTSAISGLYLAFPEYVLTIVSFLSHSPERSTEKGVQSRLSADIPSFNIDEAVGIAHRTFPEGELKLIGLPPDAHGVYRIVMRQPGEVRHSSGESQVWIDQYSGSVVKVRDWRTLGAGDTFVAWLFPLHNGEAFGLIGRIIVFTMGFAPTLLYVTAIRMWRVKRAARQKQKANQFV